jgi:hypothetical protein
MVPGVFCIDAEPDAREVSMPAPGGWSGFEKAIADVEVLRDVLGHAGTAVVNWCIRVDPQIAEAHGHAAWALRHYRADIDALLDDGDEIGLHPHSWRWDERFRRWISDNGDEAWVGRVLDEALELYASELGTPCRIHRYGDRYISAAVTDRLSDAGVLVDLTIEPGLPARPGLVPSEASTGEVPLTPFDRTLPYRARRGSFSEPAPPEQPGVTMVPLTTGLAPGLSHPETLSLVSAPASFARRLRLRLLDPDLRHLAFVVRSDWMLDTDSCEHLVANLDHVARAVPDLEWVRASSLAVLATPDGGSWSSGPLGGAATELDRVAEALAVGPGERPAVTAERTAVELVQLRSHLADATRTADEAQARAAELTERATVAERVAADDAVAIDGATQRVAELEAVVAGMQATVTWRLRRRLLPMLRPAARLLRRTKSTS